MGQTAPAASTRTFVATKRLAFANAHCMFLLPATADNLLQNCTRRPHFHQFYDLFWVIPTTGHRCQRGSHDHADNLVYLERLIDLETILQPAAAQICCGSNRARPHERSC